MKKAIAAIIFTAAATASALVDTNHTSIAGQFYADAQSDVAWFTPTANKSFTNAPMCWAQGELRTATFPFSRAGRSAFLGYRGAAATTNDLTFKIGTNAVMTATVETTREGGWRVLAATNVAPATLWFTNSVADPTTTVPLVGYEADGTSEWREVTYVYVAGTETYTMETPLDGGTVSTNGYQKWAWLDTAAGYTIGAEFVAEFAPRRGAGGKVCGLRLTAKYRFANEFPNGNCHNYPADGARRWLMAKRGTYADFPLTDYTVGNEFDVAGADNSPATTAYVDAKPQLAFENGGFAVYTNGVKAGTLQFSPVE